MKVMVRENMDVDHLLKKETSFLAEPQSTNGCVMSMDIKDIKKI